MGEHVIVYDAVTGLFSGDDHFHGQNRAAAGLEEIIFRPQTFHAKDAAEDFTEILLRFSLRGHITRLLKRRLRQGLFIHLLVDGERYLVDLHDGGGHHISGLLPLDKLPERVHIHCAFADDESRQILAAALVIIGLDSHVPNALKAADDRLDLLGFDPEAPDLDLPVLPAHKFHIAAGPVAHDVAGVVHAEPVEGAGSVSLRRFIRAIQVDPRDLRAGQAVFPGRSGRQPVPGLVEHISVDGGGGFSDGNIRLPIPDGEHAHAAAVLRGAVSVGNRIAELGGIDSRELFAAHDQEPQGLQLWIVLDKLHAHLGGHQKRGDACFVEVSCQRPQIHANLLRDQADGAAVLQGAEHILHVYVKAKGSVSADHVFSGAKLVPLAVGIGDQVPVLSVSEPEGSAITTVTGFGSESLWFSSPTALYQT